MIVSFDIRLNVSIQHSGFDPVCQRIANLECAKLCDFLNCEIGDLLKIENGLRLMYLRV